MEEQTKNKRLRIIAICGISFLVIMWVLTLVSKGIYASKLPMVTVVKPAEKFIVHSVIADGYVEESGGLAIHTIPGLRIEKVYVGLGDLIEVGDPLYQIEIEDLKSIIKTKNQEIKKLQLQNKDIKSKQEKNKQSQEIELNRLQQDKEMALDLGSTEVERAKQQVAQAESNLNTHLSNKPASTSSDDKAKQQKIYEDYKKEVKRVEDLIQSLTNEIAGLEDTSPDLEEKKADLAKAKIDYQALLDNPVSKPDYSNESSSMENWDNQKVTLEEQLVTAKNRLTDLLKSNHKSEIEIERLLEDLALQDDLDSTLQINQITLQQMQDDLAGIEKILGQEGIITATRKGMVTQIFLSSGDRTMDSPVIMVMDETNQAQLKVIVTSDERKWFEIGSEVDVLIGGSQQNNKGVLSYIEALGDGRFEVTILLPDSKATPGTLGTLCKEESGEKQPYVIPSDAVIKDDYKTYIYVVKERDGILGKERYAQKINIKIAEENKEYIAIEPGIIDQNAIVILDSTKEFKNGEVIRYMEE